MLRQTALRLLRPTGGYVLRQRVPAGRVRQRRRAVVDGAGVGQRDGRGEEAPAGSARPRAERQPKRAPGSNRRRAADLAFGRIGVSEIEMLHMLVNLVCTKLISIFHMHSA